MAFREAVELPRDLARFMDTAAVRLRALHPGARVQQVGDGFWIEHDEATSSRAAAAAMLHLLYQERIYDEARETRRALFALLLGS